MGFDYLSAIYVYLQFRLADNCPMGDRSNDPGLPPTIEPTSFSIYSRTTSRCSAGTTSVSSVSTYITLCNAQTTNGSWALTVFVPFQHSTFLRTHCMRCPIRRFRSLQTLIDLLHKPVTGRLRTTHKTVAQFAIPYAQRLQPDRAAFCLTDVISAPGTVHVAAYVTG